LGSQSASFTRKCRPSKLKRSSVETLQDQHHLLEGAQPFARARERRAGTLELGLEPARAEPCHHAATAGDLVDGGDLLGEDGRIAKEGRRDQRSEPRVLRDGGHRGELAPGLQDRELWHRHAVDVVAEPE
jgi:hypothetical protein